jgi:glutamate-1-semialdehyde 2,1-aminomutase
MHKKPEAMKRDQSVRAYAEAAQYIAGGVNSPVRALRSVGCPPLFIRRAKGVTLTDVDGNRLTDYCLSWGVFLLGHAHPKVGKAVREAVGNGTSYGVPSLPETELARMVHRLVPSVEKLRFVNSGTEAMMSAVRVARGFTGRNNIVKFDGGYHGHADHLLACAGSGVARLSAASSAGVPESLTANTFSLPFNDPEALERLFKERGDTIAAVITEPVPANMGVVPPREGFLQFLREITARHRSLLIFDEVITGFRLSAGGAQQAYRVRPDLTALGKILGGGFPAAAFGGRADIMAMLAPEGAVYQAGTLSGNPVAMSAGVATLRALSQEGYYEALEEKANRFFARLSEIIQGKNATLNRAGSLFTVFFSPKPVNSFADALETDHERFAKFFRHLLSHRIYVSPSPLEACFLSGAHSEKDLEKFIRATKKFFK